MCVGPVWWGGGGLMVGLDAVGRQWWMLCVGLVGWLPVWCGRYVEVVCECECGCGCGCDGVWCDGIVCVVFGLWCGVVSLGGNGIGVEDAAAIARTLREHPGALRHLDGLDLRTADPDLPLELKRSGNAAILDYYRDLSPGMVVFRRCRMMLLGTGGAGKTTLASRLATGAPVADGAPGVTHGVLQRKWLGISSLCVLSIPETCRR